jgi:hypothetical protein
MLRRSPLQRGKPLVTRTPLANKSPLKPGGKKIATTSKRRRQKAAAEADVRAQYVADHPICEIGLAMLQSPDPDVRRHYRSTCQITAEACHERRKRSAGGSTIDPINLLSACNPCNGWVENEPDVARSIGVSVHPWEDPATVPVYRDRVDNATPE